MRISADGPVVRRVPARVGLVGNPSDLHGGAVVAVPIPELGAIVEVAHDPDADGPVELQGPGELRGWADLAALRAEVAEHGHPPPQAIITAPMLRCLHHVGRHHPDAAVGGAWWIAWSTTVPRSVGLAGSSALAVGVIDAVATVLGQHLDPLVVAALALAAEVDDLGIVAGWQDRVVQALGVPVLVDAGRTERRDGLVVPSAEPIEWPGEVELLVGWRNDIAEDSGAHHARASAGSGDGAVDALATAARAAFRSLVVGDVAGLERSVRTTWAIRSASAPLRADHAALVESVASTGVAATTPGSGGSVVAVLRDESDRAEATAALDRQGARWLISRPDGSRAE